MGSFLRRRRHERAATHEAGMRRVSRRRCARSTKTIRIRRRSTASRNIRLGKTRKSAARTTICSGPRDPSGKTNPFSSPAAGHRRRPSTRCAGLRRGSPVSTSARRACAAPRSSSENTSWTISRCTSFPSSGHANWRRASTRSSAPACFIICPIPMRGCARCATCSSRTARCTSWCTRRTDGRASTCCRSSASGSASRHRCRDSRSHRRAQGAAAGTSAAKPAARGAGLSERGSARRCAAASVRSRVFGSAAVRVSRAAAA